MDPFCNQDCPHVHNLIGSLQAQCSSHSQEGGDESFQAAAFLRAAFQWVRDEIDYEWQLDWTVTVDRTLRRKKGNCFAKACLLVTTLRASGYYEEVSFLVAPIAISCPMVWRTAPDWALAQFPSQVSPHAIVTVKWKDRWIVLDPTIDIRLAKGMSQFGNDAALSIIPGADSSRSVTTERNVPDAIHAAFLEAGPKRHHGIRWLMVKKPAYRIGHVALMEGSATFLRKYASLFDHPQSMQRALEDFLLYQHSGSIVDSTMPSSYYNSGQKGFINYCNADQPMVQRLASKLRSKSRGDDAAFVQAAFAWVRDHILYYLQSDWNVPVEHTMAIRKGMCSTKACLLTAVLRAGGLKAAFYIKPLNAKRHFLAPSWITQFYSARSIHTISAVLLGNRWIKLDPYIDGALGRSMDQAGLVYTPGYKMFVSFDGQNHALDGPDSEDYRFVESIDDLVQKKSRVPVPVLQCHNICLDLLRTLGPIFSSSEQVLRAMEYHLLTFHPHLVEQVVQLTHGQGHTKIMASPKSKL